MECGDLRPGFLALSLQFLETRIQFVADPDERGFGLGNLFGRWAEVTSSSDSLKRLALVRKRHGTDDCARRFEGVGRAFQRSVIRVRQCRRKFADQNRRILQVLTQEFRRELIFRRRALYSDLSAVAHHAREARAGIGSIR